MCPDIGAAFGSQFQASGFSGQVTDARARRITGYRLRPQQRRGTFTDARLIHVTVAAPLSRPYIFIYAPASGATVTGSFVIAGWAADLASASGPGHRCGARLAIPTAALAGAPILAGGATLAWGAAISRHLARFTNSGYVLTVSGLPAGSYQLVAYAHSVVTGTFNAAATVSVIVR